jgi:hypothetical protein
MLCSQDTPGLFRNFSDNLGPDGPEDLDTNAVIFIIALLEPNRLYHCSNTNGQPFGAVMLREIRHKLLHCFVYGGLILGHAGKLCKVGNLRVDMRKAGVTSAVRARNAPHLFDWLMSAFAFQSIAGLTSISPRLLNRMGVPTGQGTACPRFAACAEFARPGGGAVTQRPAFYPGSNPCRAPLPRLCLRIGPRPILSCGVARRPRCAQRCSPASGSARGRAC